MSGERSSILKEAQQYAEELLSNQLSDEMTYHSIHHTRDVVSASREIGTNSGLTNDQMEIVELAAWFHDLGYTKTGEEHEEASAEMALKFLDKHQFDKEKAAQVASCIRATKIPQNPANQLEEVLCDADLIHLAANNYCDRSELLQQELQSVTGKQITPEQWYEANKEFIQKHQFFTEYARSKYEEDKKKNLEIVIEKLMNYSQESKEIAKLEKKVKKLKKKVKKVKEVKPTRGIETMFRLTSKNHLDLSALADTKANIMISVNSIILSVLVSVLFRKLEEYPHLIVPAIIMTVVCLSTIVFSILATLPNVSKGTFTDEDILSKRTNLLFFGNFHKMKREKYEWGMKEMMNDADYLYTSLIRDIYYLGVVLGRKYKLLRISYTIFMFGFVIAVLSFGIAEVFFKAPYPY